MYQDENEEDRQEVVPTTEPDVPATPQLPTMGRELLQSVVAPTLTEEVGDTSAPAPSVSQSVPTLGRELLQSVVRPPEAEQLSRPPALDVVDTPIVPDEQELMQKETREQELEQKLLSEVDDVSAITPFYATPNAQKSVEVDPALMEPYSSLLQADPRPNADVDEQIKYTPRDLVERDDLYYAIEAHLVDRRGVHMRKNSREENVAAFISHKRRFDTYNAWSVLSDAIWTSSQANNENWEVIERAQEAQAIWNNMAGFFSDEYTGEERQQAFRTYLASVITDPANVLSLFGGALLTRAISPSVNQAVTVSAARLGEQAKSRAAAQNLSAAAQNQAYHETRNRAIQRFTQGAGLGQSATARQAALASGRTADSVRYWLSTGVVDGALAASADSLYQIGLLNIDAQEEFSTASTGWAALSGLLLPVAGAVYTGIRGGIVEPISESLGVVPPGTIAAAFSATDDPVQIARRLTEAEVYPVANELVETLTRGLRDIADDIPVGDWKLSVARGRAQQEGRILDVEKDFWKALLLSDNGLAVALGRTGFGEGGIRTPLGQRFDGDNLTNNVADILRALPEAQKNALHRELQEVGGRVFPEYQNMTMDQLADALSYSMSEYGAGLGVMGTFGRQLKNAAELVEDFARNTSPIAGTGKPPTAAEKSRIEGGILDKLGGYSRYAQDFTIRSIVTHPATTALNVKGWLFHEGVYGTGRDAIKIGLYGGAGIWDIVRPGGDPTVNLNLARANFQGMMTRLNYMFDPQSAAQTTQAFADFSPIVREMLGETIYGGVVRRKTAEKWVEEVGFNPYANPITSKLESTLEFFQNTYGTIAQDMITKNVSFSLNMDRLLRERYNMTPNEFFRSPDVSDMLQSKKYRDLQLEALNMTLDSVASRSFSASATGVPADMSSVRGVISGFATVFEEARKAPLFMGLNTMPFGRFTNNQINHMIEATPLSLPFYYSGIAYEGRTQADVWGRSLAGSSLIGYMTYAAYQRLEKGQYTGYQEVIGREGDIRETKYEFPYSFFNAMGEAFAFKLYYGRDARLPEETRREIQQHILGAGITRDLSDTTNSMLSVLESFVGEDGDVDSNKMWMVQDIMQAYTSAFTSSTRPLEPLNQSVAMIRSIMGEEGYGVPDRNIGYKFLNDAFRYVDQPADVLTELITGTPLLTRRRNAATAGDVPMSGAIVSNRNLPPMTYTNWMINSIGLPEWSLSMRARTVPDAARNFNDLFFYQLEDRASRLFDDKQFKDLSFERKSMIVRDTINEARAATKDLFTRSDDGTDKKYTLMLSIAGPNSNNARANIRLMLDRYFEGANISDLEIEQLNMLDNMLKNLDIYMR